MLDFHLLEDGGGVASDEDLVDVVDDHFLHAVGAKGGLGHVGNVLAGLDVFKDGFLEPGVVARTLWEARLRGSIPL